MGVVMESAEAPVDRAAAPRRRPAPAGYYGGINGFTIETRDTDFGKIVEPIPLRGYTRAPAVRSPAPATALPAGPASAEAVVRPPPKKKWIKEYLEEEPSSPPPPVSVTVVGPVLTLPPRTNGAIARAPATAAAASAAALSPAPAPHTDFFEHSRPRSNSHGPAVSPPSGSGAGAGVRAGTREVHNKLEKNRRAHLKECFELLKRQLPSAGDDKKTSNLAILGSANRYIQVLRRKERECEHEMERLAREKIAAQQRLAALRRDAAAPPRRTPESPSSDERECREPREPRPTVNGHVLGIPISITTSAGGGPASLLAADLRARPAHLDPANQNGQPTENGASPALGAALVHPAHIHLPLSQVVRGGLVVGGAALQLVSGPAGLRVLHAHALSTNGPAGTTRDLTRVSEGVVTTSSSESGRGAAGAAAGGLVVSGLAPLVVAPGAQLLHHSLAHKVVETQLVSAGYAAAGGGVVVVSAAPSAPSAAPPLPHSRL